MWDIREQIRAASEKLCVTVEILTPEERERIKEDVICKFLDKGRDFPLFEKITDFVGIDVPESWMWISDFVKESSAILFFNPEDEKGFYKFASGEDVVAVVGEIFNVEFYVTNVSADYLLGYNHSQCLIASGTASTWLENHTGYIERYTK